MQLTLLPATLKTLLMKHITETITKLSLGQESLISEMTSTFLQSTSKTLSHPSKHTSVPQTQTTTILLTRVQQQPHTIFHKPTTAKMQVDSQLHVPSLMLLNAPLHTKLSSLYNFVTLLSPLLPKL